MQLAIANYVDIIVSAGKKIKSVLQKKKRVYALKDDALK